MIIADDGHVPTPEQVRVARITRRSRESHARTVWHGYTESRITAAFTLILSDEGELLDTLHTTAALFAE